MNSKRFVFPLALALLAMPLPAAAGGAANDAAAEALFAEAKTLKQAGDYRGALTKLLESHKLAPSVGAALNIGDCYERLDQLASAWASFKDAESIARTRGDSARESEAVRRAEALAPRLAKLAINVPPAARVPGFELRRDGTVIGEGQWGSALPVDVGQHTVEATAPGRKPWSTVVRVETNGSSTSIEVPALDAVLPNDKPARNAPASFWTGQRIAGTAVGATGLVSLGIGGVFAVVTASKNAESKLNCSPSDPNFCNDTGVAVRNEARRAAAVSTATTIIGAVAVAGGVVLVATGGSSKVQSGVQASVHVRLGGLEVRGRF
jgi:hypothetical protein